MHQDAAEMGGRHHGGAATFLFCIYKIDTFPDLSSNTGLVACSTATFRPIPTAAWRLQQLREVVGLDYRHQFLLHDRDCVFSRELDESSARVLLPVCRAPVTITAGMTLRRSASAVPTIRGRVTTWWLAMRSAKLAPDGAIQK